MKGVKKGELKVVAARTRAGKSVFRMKEGDKDYESSCESCGAKPTVFPTNLCGPCCFGDASTVGGNW